MRPFYKLRKEALEDAGISSRQESHWRSAGLFEPHAKGRYTEQDIRRLFWLKRLLDESDPEAPGLGLPVATVRALIHPIPKRRHLVYISDDPADHDPADQLLGYRFIDTLTRKLLRTRDVLPWFVASAGKHRLEEWLFKFVLWKFEQLTFESSDPEIYAAQRKRLFERFKQMDLVARAARANSFAPGELSPALPDDPKLSPEEVEALVEQRNSLLKEIDVIALEDYGDELIESSIHEYARARKAQTSPPKRVDAGVMIDD
jgi:DNA-binding transcriptional MerR regulator